MDFAAITNGLQSVQAGFELVKTLTNAGTALKEAEFKAKLAELLTLFADAKVSLVEAKTELQEKSEENKALQTALTTRALSSRFGDAYYVIDDAGLPIGDPFCSPCWERHHRVLHLVNKLTCGGTMHCPSCKTEVSRECIGPDARPYDGDPIQITTF